MTIQIVIFQPSLQKLGFNSLPNHFSIEVTYNLWIKVLTINVCFAGSLTSENLLWFGLRRRGYSFLCVFRVPFSRPSLSFCFVHIFYFSPRVLSLDGDVEKGLASVFWTDSFLTTSITSIFFITFYNLWIACPGNSSRIGKISEGHLHFFSPQLTCI